MALCVTFWARGWLWWKPRSCCVCLCASWAVRRNIKFCECILTYWQHAATSNTRRARNLIHHNLCCWRLYLSPIPTRARTDTIVGTQSGQKKFHCKSKKVSIISEQNICTQSLCWHHARCWQRHCWVRKLFPIKFAIISRMKLRTECVYVSVCICVSCALEICTNTTSILTIQERVNAHEYRGRESFGQEVSFVVVITQRLFPRCCAKHHLLRCDRSGRYFNRINLTCVITSMCSVMYLIKYNRKSDISFEM